jgi:aryl-alcohol dehydrogenase-like predicted oxidoreductase
LNVVVSWPAIGTVGLGPAGDVPRLGFGGAWITGPGTFGPPADRGAAVRSVRAAVEGGVRLVDTADCYGPEVSETLVCEALHPYPEGVVVSTKGGRIQHGPNRWEADASPEHLRSACEGSLRRLRLDAIGLYQLNNVDPKVPVEESIGALVELRDEGKIRAVGMCNVTVDELARARAVTPIVSVQNRYDLFTRDQQDVRDLCSEQGIAFLPWFPPVNSTTADASSVLGRVATTHRATPGQVVLAWMLATGATTVPLAGTIDPEWEAENLAAVQLDLGAGEVRELTENAR